MNRSKGLFRPCISIALTLAILPVGVVLAEQPENTVAEQLVMSSEGFLASHPDLRWRREGLFAYERGDAETAARYFKRAAEFADKPSQAVYAELLWRGEGVEQDRVLAYAWMDLAAERGYRLFVAKREGFWAELDAAERQRALRDGPAIYDRYGDDVAKPRLNRLLTKGRQGVTGSRVGHVGKIDIMLPGPGGVWWHVTGDDLYQQRFWHPASYWAWQDETWRELRAGSVEILPMEQISDGGPGA